MKNLIKITGGIYRGRRLKTPGEKTHPMGERERIALFNMILEYLPGAIVIDAYAGSGALGIEAISRGASKVIFIEKNPVAMQVIKENCNILDLAEEQVDFYQGAVGNIDSFDSGLFQADIVLADPPYDNFKFDEAIKISERYLKSGGILALSHPDEAIDIPDMVLLKTRKYARAHISIYRKA